MAYLLRGEVYEQTPDLGKSLDKSLADFSQAIALLSDPAHAGEAREALRWAFEGRAWVRERLGQHQDAIDDATAALKFADWGKRSEALNQRAYIRAVAGIELDQGLDDISQRSLDSSMPTTIRSPAPRSSSILAAISICG